MILFTCMKGCCEIKINNDIYYHKKKYKKNKKAGAFIYDPVTKKVLLVQSRGNLWGPPKGSFEKNETDIQCAKREVFEETGLHVYENELIQKYRIKNTSYFFLIKNECFVNINNNIKENDASGICWINIECLNKLIINRHMFITQNCRILFKRIFNIILP